MSSERDFGEKLRQIHQLGLLAYDLGRRLNQDGNLAFNGWIFLDGAIGVDEERIPLQVDGQTFLPVLVEDIFVNKSQEGVSFIDVFSSFYTEKSEESLSPPLPHLSCLPSNLYPFLLYASGRLRSGLFETRLNLPNWRVTWLNNATEILGGVNCSLRRFDISGSGFTVSALDYVYFPDTCGDSLLYFNENVVYDDDQKKEETEWIRRVVIKYIRKILQSDMQKSNLRGFFSIILTPEIRCRISQTGLQW